MWRLKNQEQKKSGLGGEPGGNHTINRQGSGDKGRVKYKQIYKEREGK